MAVQIFPSQPGFGTLLGTGISKGISSELEDLAKRKLESLQKKNMLSSLLQANVPKNVASAVVNSPKSLQREMFKPLLRINRELDRNVGDSPQETGRQKGISALQNLRKQILNNIKNGKIQQNVVRENLLSRGVTPEEVDVLLGSELNDNIVRYFLDKTNNDPKKARKLAKKFGYKV